LLVCKHGVSGLAKAKALNTMTFSIVSFMYYRINNPQTGKSSSAFNYINGVVCSLKIFKNTKSWLCNVDTAKVITENLDAALNKLKNSFGCGCSIAVTSEGVKLLLRVVGVCLQRSCLEY